jgi:chlorophyllide a reductase subunit Y
MQAFFDGVGEGYSGGIWEETPADRPKFKAKYAAQNALAAKAAEAIGT